MNDSNRDIVIELTKLDVPESEGYVCLGHFDCAKIKQVSPVDFSTFKKSEYGSNYNNDTKNPEGNQRNYLINSRHTFGTELEDPHFKFMMTISAKRTNDATRLSDYVDKFINRLNSNPAAYNSFLWQFYYPVSRGDIILILDSDNFAGTTNALYKFVCDNKQILSSYTIPMIKKSWVESDNITDESKNADVNCTLCLRATVKEYQALYNLIDKAKIPCENGFPKFLVSFGTDDVQVDFGQFNEAKLHTYLKYITTNGGQAQLRNAVFSAELDVPRIIKRKK